MGEGSNMTQEQFQHLTAQRTAWKTNNSGGIGRGQGRGGQEQTNEICQFASTMNSFIQSMRCTNPPPVINAGGSATQVTDLTGTTRNIIGSSNQQQGENG